MIFALMRRLDFNNPSGSTIGLFTAIMNIGGFSALFFCKYQRAVFVEPYPNAYLT